MSEDLLFAAQLGHADHIVTLIKSGVDPDWRRGDGTTTLMIAAFFGRVSIIEALLDHGASIDLRAPDGTTALMTATLYAQTTRDTSTMEALLIRNADPNLVNREGNGPLHRAARHGLLEAVELLLQCRADPNVQNKYGMTPLMQAARAHLVDTVRLLLRAGADPTIQNVAGRTALAGARELRNVPGELVTLLGRDRSLRPIGMRDTVKFDRPEFKLALVGTWEEEIHGPEYLYAEPSGERWIQVTVEPAREALAVDFRREALADEVAARKEAMLELAGGRATFSDVRVVVAGEIVQARFHGVDESRDGFFFVCVYGAMTKFVTLAYHDLRPRLTPEARGLQAEESVASFRVK